MIVVHVIIIDQWNQTEGLYKMWVTGIYSHSIRVPVTSECHVQRVIFKTWTGTLANSADPDQMPQNAASDHGLHCLLTLQEVNPRSGPFSQPTLRDNRPTSAVSALILSWHNFATSLIKCQVKSGFTMHVNKTKFTLHIWIHPSKQQ